MLRPRERPARARARSGRAARSICASERPRHSARRGHLGAGRLAAVLGMVRGPGRGLPRLGPPRRGAGPRGGGGSLLRLGAATPTTSVSIDHFGASAPGQAVLEHFGYTVRARGRARARPVRRRGTARRRIGGRRDQAARLYAKQGQSPWLDNLRRDCLRGGRLAEFVARASAASPRTPRSSPRPSRARTTTTSSSASLLSPGHVEEAYWELVIDDIVDALGVLAAGPRRSRRRRRLRVARGGAGPGPRHRRHGAIGAFAPRADRPCPTSSSRSRPPPRGSPPIRRLIGEGRSINITLIFSLERYDEVMEAYIGGLEDSAAAGHDDLSPVRSVASFFVSRVDTEVDRRLETARRPGDDAATRRSSALRGTRRRGPGPGGLPAFRRRLLRAPLGGAGGEGGQGAASAVGLDVDQEPRLPRPRLRRHPHRPRHRQHDARRPPSTPSSTTAPWPGRSTPIPTARRDGPGAARRRSASTWPTWHRTLEDEGVASLRQVLRRADPDALRQGQRPVGRQLTDRRESTTPARSWPRLLERDAGLWPAGNVSANRLGWLEVPRRMAAEAADLAAWAGGIEQSTVVLLGMGGSSLGPAVLEAVSPPPARRRPGPDAPKLVVCDTTHPDDGRRPRLLRRLRPRVVEVGHHPRAQRAVRATPGRSCPTRRATRPSPTPGPRSPHLAAERGFRRCFENPPDIGGRYSVLSYFGMVPAALHRLRRRRALRAGPRRRRRGGGRARHGHGRGRQAPGGTR